jgi:DNA polymerase III sliding clamp (beta) subunit (PCNA family)
MHSFASIFLTEVEEDFAFSLDCNSFLNAFMNFPTNEIQFVYNSENNLLIFGNKKTRVSLSTSLVSENNLESVSKIFTYKEDDQIDVQIDDFIKGIKYTLFACAPDAEEHPYTSILWYVKNNEVCCQASDKHRIALYGDSALSNHSYLITKSNSDNIVNFLEYRKDSSVFLSKNTLFLVTDKDKFGCLLEMNDYQAVFDNYKKFFEQAESIFSVTLDKTDVIKSVKFISNISSANTVNFQFENDSLILGSSSHDKGSAIDKIQLDEPVENLSVVYLASHINKVLDILPDCNVIFDFLDYNGYTLLKLQANKYSHLIFPME